MNTQRSKDRYMFFSTWFGGSAYRFLIMALVALGVSAGSRAYAADPVAGTAPPAPDQLPTGGQVVAGQATLQQRLDDDTAVLDVQQNTRRAVINWDTFDLGSQAQVNFNQPGSDAATLNRVLGIDPSRIYGNINATGQVFLTNPNGVLFGESASVDVGGLVATTGSIDDADFMAGNFVLRRDGADGSIENYGNLQAGLGGYIALLAPEVRNSGVVIARAGTVVMAAGEVITLDIEGGQLAGITAEPAAVRSLIENRSAVLAPGGNIILSGKALDALQGGVVRNSGRLEATGIGSRAGRIVLEASHSLYNSGLLDASGETGGSISVTADTVRLGESSVIDASGVFGGGDVRVGGGLYGDDPSLANAERVIMEEGSSIDASALRSGDGGQVVLWADGQTDFTGDIRARGGAESGDGGFVEVSGKEVLNFRGTVDAGADNGAGGTLLLDPRNIVIEAGGGAATTAVDQFADTPSQDSIIAPATITAVTDTGTGVTLQANNDLTVNSAIVTNNAGGAGGALTFQAGRNITVNANINSDDGNINFTVNDAGADGTHRAAGNATFTNNSLIDAGAGAVSITMGTEGASGAISTGQITGGTLNITHNGPTLGAVSGAIDLGETNVNGNIAINADSARNVTNTLGTVIGRGTTTINVGAGDVTIDRSTTDFNIIGLTADNVLLNDANAMRFANTDLSGNLTATTVGPIGSTGALLVDGAASFTANHGGFGFADPYIALTSASNDFAGGVTLSVPSSGIGTGGYANIRDAGALDITAANLARQLTVTAGGAVDLGPTSLGTDLTISTAGAVTDSGTITAPGQTSITAGSGNNITLDGAANNFNAVRIVSGNNVTLVDTNGINFGSRFNSSNFQSQISGDLAVTAGGNITQSHYSWHDGYSAITVGGATTFTANNASSPIDLLLGPTDPFSGFTGQSNSFTGEVTLARTNSNTGFRNVQLRNTSATASVLTGLTSVGDLNNVFLRYDNAPAVELPGMTLSGSLKLHAPSVVNTASTPANLISQTGPISVAGDTMIRAATTGDVDLSNSGNDFNRVNILFSRNATLTDTNAIVLYGNSYRSNIRGDLSVTANGAITDGSTSNSNYYIDVDGTASLNAGSTNNITLDNPYNRWNIVEIPAANNVVLNPSQSLIFGDAAIEGTLSSDALFGGGTLTQLSSTAISTGGTTTFRDFTSGITLDESGNVFGDLALSNYGPVAIRENDAITQASAWNDADAVSLTTSNDQAITLDQANRFGALTITQLNNGAASAGAVYVRETNDSSGLTQGGAWTTNGTVRLDTGAYSIALTNPDNILGPLQVTGATSGGTRNVTIYAKETATTEAITDVGGTGAWNTGSGSVRLIAYNQSGTTAGGGNVILENAGNQLGDLYIKATDATITENTSITDGALTSWNGAGDTGWVTTGTVNLVVANPSGKTITLDNVTNELGPLGVSTTGAAGTLSSVLITDNTDLTQAAVWDVGTAPVTLDARANQIDLSSFSNVLGAINIRTINGTPTSVAITEDDAITQGGVWSLTGVPVTLVAENGNAITLNNAANIMGDLTITGGAVSIRENDSITQSGAWTTTGNTTLNPTDEAITLTDPANVLGPLAIAGTPSGVNIVEADDITQASAWTQGATPFTLSAGTNDILLSQAGNQLGDLTLSAQNAVVTENQAAGITDGGAWTIPGTTTLTAGSANPIVLNANPAGDFGTVSIVSASNADISDVNAIDFGTSTIAAGGTLTVTAGGEITQSGAITAPSLRLIGTGFATLTNTANDVDNLAAGFSGGNLQFVNGDDFAVAVVGGTSGVTIGANDVTLQSVNGTVTGLSNINASSTSLALTTGTALVLPQMNIAGPQTYTASTVSGSGITLNGNVTSTAAGAITFNSPVTLGADLTVQSTNSAIDFLSTVAGNANQLTVNAGTGLVNFQDTVSGLGSVSDPSAALTVNAGGTTFSSTLAANNGLAIGGPVTFNDTVTLADGSVGSLFTGLVTLGRAGGMDLSGYDGLTFNAGILLQNGAATIDSNNSALTFQTSGTVSGPFDLTLDAGTAALTGLDRLDTDLTSLTVTALNPVVPAGGISISGPQSYTATSGSSITLNGDVTSTAAGTIDFNSPVTLGAAVAVTSVDSAVTFAGAVNGNNDLTVNSGSAATNFNGAVGDISAVGDGTGESIILTSSGETSFAATVETRSGISADGAVNFEDDVTMGNGNTGSTFTGLVTAGGVDGNSISGFDGIAFNAGLALTGGPVSVASNGSTLSFGGPVTGTQDLTLNALAGGAGTVTGLDQIGFNSTLTALDITAQTLSLPSTGLAVAGPMSFTAAGTTINGAVGNSAGPATGQIDFNGPVTLATGAIAVTTANAAINFNGTVDGAQALTVNSGTGTTTFGAAVGGNSALASLTTAANGTTLISGGSIDTAGAQTYSGDVTLGGDATLTGVNVQFDGALDGGHALLVNNSGATVFNGVVGGVTPLTSITTDAPGTIEIGTSAITTSGTQTYNELMTLLTDVTFTGTGLSFDAIDGGHALLADAGTGALQFNGAIGAVTPLSSLNGTGNTLAVADAQTAGAQFYTAAGGITLNGDLSGSAVTITGPVTLGGNLGISTGSGNIVFAGPTSTINGARDLTLTAGTGDVVLGGVVGGIAPLTGITVSGDDLTLPGITTVGDINQNFIALSDITLSQSRTLNAPISFTADANGDGIGSFILLDGVSLTASNNTLDIQAADLDLQGSSTLATGSGLMTLTATNDRNIALGGVDAPGQMTISGSELSRISTSGGLTLSTTGAGWVRVDGITAAQSQNVTGTLTFDAQGSGDVGFVNTESEFNAVTARSTAGTVNVGVDLTTSNDPIEFLTAVAVAGASTINSGGGDISFDSTVAVDNDLTITTGNGALTFSDAVGSNQTLTLNLGGGSVTGLGQLQTALTGLTVNSTSGITLPAFTISGPQVYNTGPITVTGDLGGEGITFNNLVDVVPASSTSLTLDSGTAALTFNDLVSFNAVDMTLTGDEIDFTRAVTGSGALLMQPATGSRDVALGGSGTPIVGLNLTAAELAWLPIGTLSSLTIGSAAGTGALDVAGPLNAPGTPLTLNGGGGITQSGGSVTSGSLTLYAAGNAIALDNGANAFDAVGINGTPSSVSLVNTQNITQLGAAAWNLGSAPVTLDAGNNAITLNSAGNTFGTLSLTGGEVRVTEAAAADIGASNIGENLTVDADGGINVSGALDVAADVSLTTTGLVTQSAPLTIGGDLDIATTIAAGDVTIDNSGADATVIGDTLVGGDYSLTASGDPVSQAAGSTLQVRGDLTVSGDSIVLGGAGNLVGGTTTLPATDTVELRQSGVITLGDRNDTGNLTVISERTNRSFSSALINGNAVVLDNASNNIGGTISVSASPPTVTSGADVQTGINQTAGTSITVAGVASFTAEASSAGSLGIDLSNAGNNFGVLQLSGNNITVNNSATGLTTIDSALGLSLDLTTAGGVAQTGAIVAPTLSVAANGSVNLNNALNDTDTLTVTSGGGDISYQDADDFVIAGIDAGGGAVSLTASGNGSVTQTAALANVGALSVNAGGAVTLTDTANRIAALGASSAGTGVEIFDSADGIEVNGIVSTSAGDLEVRTNGDLTLNAGGRLQADAGGVVASTEGNGNFINNSGASALVVGSGERWLVYSATPDLVDGPSTVKGGLTSSFRHYGDTYGSYGPNSVSQTGNGFIYSDPAPTLTVSAIIDGTPGHIYGDAPGGVLDYTVSSGLVDSEDNIGNIISGGTATYSGALSNTMGAGDYSFTYTGGLTSPYTLVADPTGVAYTVTPATLTYTADPASRVYGAANPGFGGTISGFKLGQDASVLTGTASWTTAATSASDVGDYAINGSGYSATNYTFEQAPGNATAFSITPASLIVTVNDDAFVYDGTAYSGGNGVSFGPFVNGDDAGDLGGAIVYGGSAQGARNAGSYTISASGLTATNYDIAYVDGTLDIARADLVISTEDVVKTYDGSLGAAGTAVAAGGTQLFDTDSLSGGTFAFTDANAGSGDKTVTVSGVTVSDGNGGNNYNVSYVLNTTSTINPASITVASGDVVKTYDGTLSAAGTAVLVSGALYNNVSNGNVQDSLSGGTFAFTDPNAGSGNKTVTLEGVTVNDGNGGGNYIVSFADNTTSTINPAILTFAGEIETREYDGTTVATLSDYTLTGFVGSETLTATTASAEFADKNAGSGKTVFIDGIALADGTNGGLASNYTVSSTATATGAIDPKQLAVSVDVADRVYDGTTSATLNGFELTGFVGSETVTGVYTGSATFADKNAGDDKIVEVTGINLVDGTNGGLAANYAVPGTANGAADITPATLQIAGVVALDKVYDGTVTANLDTENAVLSGTIGSDDVQVSSITGTFADKNVGVEKSIGAGEVMLIGTDAGNYLLIQPTGLTASITPRSLVVSAVGFDKVYDGTTFATVNLEDNRVDGDVLEIAADSAFMDKNAGVGKFIDVSNIAISGTDAANYTVNTDTSTFADIARAELSVTAVAADKVYDGTAAAFVTLDGTPLDGDEVTLAYGSASFADKNAGNDKVVSIDNIVLSGTDAGNYAISGAVSASADITPAVLTVNASGQSKAYDGNTGAQVSLSDDRITGDDLVLDYSAAFFADPNVGQDKSVSVTGIQINAGADSGNYVLASSTAATTADITGEPPAFEDRIWTLPPMLPSAEPPSAPAEPAEVMSLDLPQDLGGNALTAVEMASAEGTGALFEAAPAGDPQGTAASDTGIAGAAGATPAGDPQGTAASDSGIAGTAEATPAGGPQGTAASDSGIAGTAEATPAGGPQGTAASDSGVAGATEATPAGGPQGTAATDARIAVAVAYPPMGANPGMVTVVIPQAIVSAGEAFSFKMPSTMTKGPVASQVSLLNGDPLPAWLHYEVDTWTFTATNMPGDALPIQVRVVIDEEPWTVRLTQQ